MIDQTTIFAKSFSFGEGSHVPTRRRELPPHLTSLRVAHPLYIDTLTLRPQNTYFTSSLHTLTPPAEFFKMAEAHSTPRITSPHLEHFTSRTIRIIGKVSQLRGETANIDSDGVVTLQLSHDSHLTVNNYVEVVGRVNGDLSVKVLQCTDLGKNGECYREMECRA